MTVRTFAAWVEPVAAELRETRGAIVEVARSIPAAAWTRPSPNEGWTYKELLGHLASGDWVCHIILRAAVADEQADLSVLSELDARNARLLEERAGRSTEELIAEVEAENDETQDLLSRLSDEDDQRTQEGAPMSLGEYLRMFPDHDRGHLADLRTAVEA